MATIVDSILAALRRLESGSYRGDYHAESPYSSASGAYQIIDKTWGGYAGYRRASLAPAAVQDEFARREVSRLLTKFRGNEAMVFASWYVGEGVAAAKGAQSTYVPPKNSLSIKQYVDRAMRFFGFGGNRNDMPPQDERIYPRMTEVDPPPLGVPSRANQKANIFTKEFDPKKRRMIILLIAALLLFLALVSYD